MKDKLKFLLLNSFKKNKEKKQEKPNEETELKKMISNNDELRVTQSTEYVTEKSFYTTEDSKEISYVDTRERIHSMNNMHSFGDSYEDRINRMKLMRDEQIKNGNLNMAIAMDQEIRKVLDQKYSDYNDEWYNE